MIDIVTIFTNTELYDQMKKSAFSNDVNINFVGIDNTNNKYSSAAAAYNEALMNLCHSEVIVFCHQDVIFPKGEIDLINALCTAHKNVCFGVAGVKNVGPEKHTISSIKDGNGKYETLKPGELCEVFSLDECLLCGSREVFSRHRFDAELCTGFHLYAVDFSIACHEHGIKVMVYGSGLTHLSAGKVDNSFREVERKLVRKYRKKYKLITYTCGWAYTGRCRRLLYQFHWNWRRLINYLKRKMA